MLKCTPAIALIASLGCGDDTDALPFDAATADARVTPDAGVTQDGAPPLGWVDFAITGCSSGEGSEASPCLGPSPLVLRFTALAPAEVENQVWDFGDGSELDSSVSPQHRYEAPGSYALTLNVEGPGGTAGVTRLAAVVVIPAPLGAECSGDSHCATGQCTCKAVDGCLGPLGSGMCVLDCDAHAECGANRCVDLDPQQVAENDWQRTTCVPSCDTISASCDAGGRCQALRGVDGPLTLGCLPAGLLRPLGAACRNAVGERAPALCASGVCLDVGTRGMCSEPCETFPCPGGSRCATFDTGTPTPHCLPDCAISTCAGDPLLSCQLPGNGFTIEESTGTSTYCAPEN